MGFNAILSGTYTEKGLYEFIQLCYSLALPAIRKKIALGKLNLDQIGLRENDIVQDCLADLFRRDESNMFPEITSFFNSRVPNIDDVGDGRLLISLRQLVLGKCNNNIIRLHSEADPTLGKVFRNITLAIERTDLFEKCSRFGEGYLLVRGMDPMHHLSPVPIETVRERLLSQLSPRDTIPQMMKKLHKCLSEQTDHQRIVPIVGVALMFREVYVLAFEESATSSEPGGERNDIANLMGPVLGRFEKEMHETYVESGKRTADVFDSYMLALKELLRNEFVAGESDGSYFEHLKAHIPDLTKPSYIKHHRAVFEYLAKTAKDRMRLELRKM